jgi:O-methyltransferase involved in polyketide biosynthesis
MIGMADRSSDTQPENAGLGAVQQTLFIPLAARARESRKKRPILRDPKAAEIVASVDFDTAKYGRGWGGFLTVPRTARCTGSTWTCRTRSACGASSSPIPAGGGCSPPRR